MRLTLNTNYPKSLKRSKCSILPIDSAVTQPIKAIKKKYINVKARDIYPFKFLSNFSVTNFQLDGIKIKSMEGFLQSLKINDLEKQKQMCLLDGFEAKKMSKSIKRSENDMILYWGGKSLLRGSEEYKKLKQAVINASTHTKDGSFEFDGKKISSINAFLTAIKVESPEIQELILKMSQENLKQVSKNIKPKYQIRNLYWNENVIKRDSEEYQNLLDRAYKARYCSDFYFRMALNASKNYELIHTKGKNDMSETILTQDEFLQRLNALRQNKNYKYKLLDTLLFPYYKTVEYLELLKNRYLKANEIEATKLS